MRNICCLLIVAAIATQAYAQPTVWVSARGAGPHHIDEIDMTGAGTGNAFDQVAGAQASAWGYRDGMADRNGHLYWGWDGGVAMHFMDGTGGTQIISGSAPGGVGTYRAMAYDPDGDAGAGSFYVQSFTSPMAEVNMSGGLIRSLNGGFNNGTVLYGFAFDDVDGNVWAHEALGDVVKIDTVTGNTIESTRFPTAFPLPAGPGGLSGIHDGTGRMAALSQGSPDLWGIYDTSGGFTGPYDVEIVTGENGNLGIAVAMGGDPCAGQICGDTNCDAVFNGGDIDPFFLALGNPGLWKATYPNCDLLCVADINYDGAVNGGDIDPFFRGLGGGRCMPSPIPPPARDLQITDFNRPANPPANDVQSP